MQATAITPKILTLVAATLVAISTAGLPATAALRQSDHVVMVTDRDNNTTVDLTVGDTLVVRLASNSSTGYAWRIAQNNAALLAPQGEPVYEKSASTLPGAQGTQVFTFIAKAAGGDGLTLLYQRPNAGSQDAHTFRLRAVISEAAPAAGKTITLADADANSAIKAAVGDTLVVRLTALPSAGFSWKIIDNAPAVLKEAGNAQVRGATRPGASITQVFTFTVAAAGEAALKLAYQRAGTGQTTRTWQAFVDVPAAHSSAAATRSILANFACDAGVTFQATFGGDVAAVTFNNITKTLKQQPAADGARYADADWELRSAGGKTTLTDLKANKAVAENCVDQNAVTPQTPAAQATTVTYTCRDNSAFTVVFDGNFATVTYNGKTEALSRAPAADGMSYANPVWALRGKGNEATLTDLAMNKPVGEQCTSLPSAATSAPRAILASFTCDAGVTLQVSFSGDVASITFKDVTKTLKQQPAADGFRYADAEWELRGKGKDATLTDLATGQVVANNCKSQ